MTIIVVTREHGDFDFDDATRYVTDEHNNLEIMVGREGDRPVACFASDEWIVVSVDGDSV